ncbi:MAG TPA: glycosyltransferase family 9 protein [Bacteroidota bacterium]|nr:glycosyltransferase family 9 protein [Bacteroidota bacterium]
MLRSIEPVFKRSLSAGLRHLFGSNAPLPFDPGSPPRILVIRQHNQLGDMLCVVPLLRALRRTYPRAYIALMASPVNCAPMVGNRYVDEVINFDKREFMGREGGSLLRLPGYSRGLRERKFTVAAVPSTVSTSFTSDLMAYLSGAPVRVGAASLEGQANPSGFFFTHPRDLDWRGSPGRHQAERNMDIWPVNLEGEDDLSAEITLTPGEIADGEAFMRSLSGGASRVIAYHPGAGKVPNRWPAERFAALADRLSGYGAAVITAGPMDDEPVEAMTRAMRAPGGLIRNQPIRRVASALRFADLVICNDTGIMHVAAAVGTPVLSLFGPTDPRQWAPTGPRHRSIRGEGGDIRTISLEQVAGAAEEMLRPERAR